MEAVARLFVTPVALVALAGGVALVALAGGVALALTGVIRSGRWVALGYPLVVVGRHLVRGRRLSRLRARRRVARAGGSNLRLGTHIAGLERLAGGRRVHGVRNRPHEPSTVPNIAESVHRYRGSAPGRPRTIPSRPAGNAGADHRIWSIQHAAKRRGCRGVGNRPCGPVVDRPGPADDSLRHVIRRDAVGHDWVDRHLGRVGANRLDRRWTLQRRAVDRVSHVVGGRPPAPPARSGSRPLVSDTGPGPRGPGADGIAACRSPRKERERPYW